MNIKPVIAQKSPYPIEVERENPITGVSAVKARNNPSVMPPTKALPLALSYTRLQKQKKCIFVDVNLLPINPFVMERIQKFRNK